MAFNVIDEILSDFEPNYSHMDMSEAATLGEDFKAMSTDESDTDFLDDLTGNSDHTNITVMASHDNHRVRAGAALSGDSILADVVYSLEVAQKANPEQNLKTFDQVLKAGEKMLPKSASVFLTKAILRLKRVASKTPEQMEEDGAKTASDYADPLLVPHWAAQVRKDVTLIRRAYADTLPKAKKAATETSDSALAKKQLSDSEVKNYLKKLLNDGVEPHKIAARIDKMAELLVFNKSMATDYLNQNAGVIGYAYMEPNSYMDKCSDSYERQTTKLGGVKAKSVRQLKACTACTFFSKSASDKRCNLYHLPIVANASELLPIVNNITAGAKNKQAALIRLANRTDQKGPVQAEKIASTKTSQSHHMSNAGHAVKTATFTANDAVKMHQAGKTLVDIYDFGIQKVGSAQAKDTVRRFIAGLKGTKTKVALSQIDCTMLKGKLSASNPIIGARKCGSCTYRRGMSCGLTGGTLASFEGMKSASNGGPKTASTSPKDGMGMLNEFEMGGRTAMSDIDVSGHTYASVDIGGGK